MHYFIDKFIDITKSIFKYPELTKTMLNYINIEFCSDLLFLKKSLGFHFTTIIDAGAAIGEYTEAARFVFPDAKILSFEPIPESFAKLECVATKLKNVKCFNVALGDKEGEAEFHLNAFSFSSSLLQMTNIHKEIWPYTKDETIIKVKTSRLDKLLQIEKKEKVLLKIDVQGFELIVLKGCTDILNSIDVIQLEVSFINFYDNQAKPEDLIAFLREYGFTAFFQTEPVFKGGKLLCTDFVFLRNS